MKAAKITALIVLITAVVVGGYFRFKSKPEPMRTTDIKVTYPKAVFNECTNLWAVRAEQRTTFGRLSGFFGKSRSPLGGADSVSYADLGEEYTFPDSPTAIRTYQNYCIRVAETNRQFAIAARIEDSLFKCNHNYRP